VLLEEGYRYDSSIFPIRHDRYGIPVSERQPYAIDRPQGSLLEFPGSTTKVGPMNLPVAGGGYFRIFPYRYTRWGISRVNRLERRPVVFYLHPWEIDPDQPRLPAGRLGAFRHYRNLALTESRLRQLLRDFKFGTMEALLREVGTRDGAAHAHPLPLPYCW
jgi:polysaccharide deacetylase family protein (PEP-CTERM system associated)